MQKVQQKDLKVGQIVADTSRVADCSLFEVVQKGSFTDNRLLLRFITGDTFYGKVCDEENVLSYGTNMVYGGETWYLPTNEELELINKR